MNGFKNATFNNKIATSILNHIISIVLACFEKMMDDYKMNNIKITNNESVIRDHLFNNYLNNDEIMKNMGFDNFRFFSSITFLRFL